MTPSLRATLDHVAVAVPDRASAAARWADQLGGGTVARDANSGFAIHQLRYAGGGKLELLAPPDDPPAENFVSRFLKRYGPTIHHVTLKVGDLDSALAQIRAAGLDVVDVQDTHPHWREGFLRPAQVGGLIVQVAWAAGSDEQWAAQLGQKPEPPRADAATLLGPRLAHPDLGAARRLWETLGASITELGDALVARWPDSPLTVEIVTGARAGPVALRMRDAPALEADATLGPAIVLD